MARGRNPAGEDAILTKYNTELVSQMSASLTVEDNLLLVPRVAAGDEDAKREMIEGNMALVISTTDDYLRRHPQYAYLRDDLTSAAFIGLIDAVGNIIGIEGEAAVDLKAPVEYLRVAIKRSLWHATETEAMVRIPHATQHGATAEGNRIPPIVPSSTSLDTCTCNSDESVFEMRDLIQSCCATQAELTFIEMRECGYSVKEIADALEISVPKTYRMKREIYARVLVKSGLKHIKKGKD